MIRSACSETPLRHRGPGAEGVLLVLEGLPGAGKTTAAQALGRDFPVLGEYARPDGRTLAKSAHPAADHDGAHQDNWVIKARLAQEYLATNPVVIADRDWLTSLAYAHSIADDKLLAQRCAWLLRHLSRRTLRIGDLYVVLDIDPATSQARRSRQMPSDHPWSDRSALERLIAFYADPAAALAPVSPPVAALLDQARIHHRSALAPVDDIVDAVRELLQ